jgi:hypothetical protein
MDEFLNSVVVVGFLGFVVVAVEALLLPFGRIHSNTGSCKCGLYKSVSSSHKSLSSLALFVASFFFLVRMRWQRLEQDLPFAVSAMNGAPQHSQFRVTGRMDWPP